MLLMDLWRDGHDICDTKKVLVGLASSAAARGGNQRTSAIWSGLQVFVDFNDHLWASSGKDASKAISLDGMPANVCGLSLLN